MVEQILCPSCGAVLVAEVTDEGVRPVGAEDVIPFRRTTDYVVCTECFESYAVRALMEMRRHRVEGTGSNDGQAG